MAWHQTGENTLTPWLQMLPQGVKTRIKLVTDLVLDNHEDVINWKNFPRNWPFVRGIHRSPVNSPHKGQWRGALMYSLICVWINDWVNNREAGDLRPYHAHYDVIVMDWQKVILSQFCHGQYVTITWWYLPSDHDSRHIGAFPSKISLFKR